MQFGEQVQNHRLILNMQAPYPKPFCLVELQLASKTKPLYGTLPHFLLKETRKPPHWLTANTEKAGKSKDWAKFI